MLLAIKRRWGWAGNGKRWMVLWFVDWAFYTVTCVAFCSYIALFVPLGWRTWSLSRPNQVPIQPLLPAHPHRRFIANNISTSNPLGSVFSEQFTGSHSIYLIYFVTGYSISWLCLNMFTAFLHCFWMCWSLIAWRGGWGTRMPWSFFVIFSPFSYASVVWLEARLVMDLMSSDDVLTRPHILTSFNSHIIGRIQFQLWNMEVTGPQIGFGEKLSTFA